MRKLLFISLGCDKNRVDSEVMLELLEKNGYEITDDETEAEVIVINTCCFIGDAKEESIDTILEMAKYRRDGNCRALIVSGCLAERYRLEIITEIPEVDALLGTTAYDKIVEAANDALSGSHREYFRPLDVLPAMSGNRIVTTGECYAYLKIAEGCDKHCTYCIIPRVRGSYRSYPTEDLVREAEHLSENGVRELILVAQETTVYGTDLYGEKRLPDLLRKLCRIEGLRWIRILYCYPEEITDELIEVMREEPKICHYIDMPIQHVNNDILKRMGRRTTKEELTAVIRKLRDAIPDIALRTTLIAGFPGERQCDHEELMDFIDEMEFDRLGVFSYSQEEDTPAAGYPDQVSDRQKDEWRDELMELQQEISREKSAALKEHVLDVMIDGRIPEEGEYIGRTYRDAPDVDGYIFLDSNEELMSGTFVRARVTGSSEYDLTGVIEDEFA